MLRTNVLKMMFFDLVVTEDGHGREVIHIIDKDNHAVGRLTAKGIQIFPSCQESVAKPKEVI